MPYSSIKPRKPDAIHTAAAGGPFLPELALLPRLESLSFTGLETAVLPREWGEAGAFPSLTS